MYHWDVISLLLIRNSYSLISCCEESGRPIYTPSQAVTEESEGESQQGATDIEDEKSQKLSNSLDVENKAPRDENGELVIKRREVHSGRALTVSAVEWSVAENAATPTSTLEGFMWDKETEVDRFRERIPLANLVSQWKLSTLDPSKPKPRDWISPIKEAAASGHFVIIPECKRMEPFTGSLRKRYDIAKLVKDFTIAGALAISINCDGVLFGGSLEDLTTGREATAKVSLEMGFEDEVRGPPILASDLLLYPYQLYKMRLAGADAVNLVVAALAAKDLLYLTKIASTLQMQTLLTVTSTAQIKNLEILPSGTVNGLIVSNRELENFSFDMTGQQALSLLESDELKELLQKQGKEIPVFVEGRVGLIEFGDGDTVAYLDALKEAGATGAVVAGALVPNESRLSPLESLLSA
jgi:indole-3-glycerol phosphate synthase